MLLHRKAQGDLIIHKLQSSTQDATTSLHKQAKKVSWNNQMQGCLCIISRRSNRYCIFAINYNFDDISFPSHVIRQHHQKQTCGSGVAPIAWSRHLLSQAQLPQICIWMPGLPEAHNDLAPSQLLFPSLTQSDTCSRKIHIPFSFYPVSWCLIHHFSNLHQPTNHVFWTDKTGKSLWTCTITNVEKKRSFQG